MIGNSIIRCIIVDDEPLARSVIIEHCSKIDFLEVIAECKNAIEASSILHKQTIDLVFLDIDMPYLTGIEFVKQLKPFPAIVFTTAYSEHAVEGFELDAVDYLLKPISFNRFFKTANKALLRLGNEPDETNEIKIHTEKENQYESFLYLKEKDKMVRLQLNDIVAIESQGHYVKIYTPIKNHIIHQSISEMEERLPSDQFVRTHRSFIVGLHHIKAYSISNIETLQVNVPIGRNYKNSVMERFKG